MKKFLNKNAIPVCFAVSFILIELFSVCFVGGFPLLTEPHFFLLLTVAFTSLLMIMKHKTSQFVVAIILLLGQIVLSVGMVFLYESNGTFFDWSMINQRNDGFGTMESLDLNIGLVVFCLIIFALFLAISIMFLSKNKKYKSKVEQIKSKTLLQKVVCGILLFVSVSTTVLIPFFKGMSERNSSYENKLYGSIYNKYQQFGITGNAISELISGNISNSVDTKHLDEVTDYVFGDKSDDYKLKTSDYFGVSAGNNLVVVLVESFEWYTWLNDKYPQETLKEVYPNLYNFMEQSVMLSNFYAREKTDTSEMLSLLGTNPTNKYVNYDFPTNEYPQSLPNMFRSSVESNGNTLVSCKSFHQNDGDFYNRNTLHESLGFDELVDIKDMHDYGVINTWSGNKSECTKERNLDSLAWNAMKNEMFPEANDGEQFFTYAITFSMHGFYNERENLKCGLNGENYYETLASHNMFKRNNTKESEYLNTYAAAVMDFDRAVGVMMQTLGQKNLLDNTTIVLFADHNTYYNNLSYYAKDIKEKYNSELYRIPCMIFDKKLVNAMEGDGNSTEITKFTTTSDLIPTIFDIFGIKAWGNLYFGSSVLLPDIESIIYSRAYGIFVTDKLICYSVKNLLYKCEGFTDKDEDDFINRAKIHLNKLERIDKIYYGNYFKHYDYPNA